MRRLFCSVVPRLRMFDVDARRFRRAFDDYLVDPSSSLHGEWRSCTPDEETQEACCATFVFQLGEAFDAGPFSKGAS